MTATSSAAEPESTFWIRRKPSSGKSEMPEGGWTEHSIMAVLNCAEPETRETP